MTFQIYPWYNGAHAVSVTPHKAVTSAGEIAFLADVPHVGELITFDGPNGPVKRRVVSITRGFLHFNGKVA